MNTDLERGPVRVALVCGYFEPASNYIEIVLARALATMAETHVLSTDAHIPGVPVNGRSQPSFRYDSGESRWGDVVVHRSHVFLNLRSRLLARGLGVTLDRIQPDVVLQMSPVQLYPLPAAHWARKNSVPLVYLSGENSEQEPAGAIARIVSAVYRRWPRRVIHRYAAVDAAKVITITPETREALTEATGRSDVELTSLPVDQSVFFFDAAIRERIRGERGWSGLVCIFAGKFEKRKDLNGLIDWWLKTFVDPSSVLILVGADSSAYANEVREHARDKSGGRVVVQGFESAQALNEMYQGADIGIFPTATIGIQQSLSTGLKVLLPNRPASRFLFSGDIALQGSAIIGDHDSITAGDPLSTWATIGEQQRDILDPDARTKRSIRARRFSADSLAEDILGVLYAS